MVNRGRTPLDTPWWRRAVTATRRYDGAAMGTRVLVVQAASKLDAEVAAIRQAETERGPDWVWRCVDSRKWWGQHK